ncbi:lactonase family protein [Saccharibacillus sp. JS10]|uniref:lactonase family protein n=1 Tax=Saccharibacillus sp. JS10 TaxID=2950552 RepID=UPI00210B91E2|nr:lactonase family protein [Saccharibacillus sp. JS10]MCQ4087408.1 lactonase family protein [Saccharibacillus sp. JS10]
MTAQHEHHFYVGTYASDQEDSLFHGVLDSSSGEMRMIAGVAGIENPSYLTIAPDGKNLYAVSEKEDGEVFAYVINADTKQLHLNDRQSSEGSSPCYVHATSDGKVLLVANYGGCVVSFAICEHGTLDQASRVKHSGSGPHPQRQDRAHPHAFVPSPDSRFYFATDLGTDRIVRYTYEEGRLFKQDDTELPAGTGPRTLVFHPTLNVAYVSGELDNTVTTLAYDRLSGRLKVLQRSFVLPYEDAKNPANTSAHVAVSPCGRYVYVSSRGDDSIALFKMDSSTGELFFVEKVSSGGHVPRHFAWVGDMLLVANQESGNVTSFKVNEADGKLTPTGFSLEVPNPVCVQPYLD